MTTTARAAARAGALGMAVGVLLLAALLGAAQPTGAAPISEPSTGWTRENFHDSCRKAGGKPRDIRQTNPETGEVDVDYSYCTFPGGSQNRCDWIKKTCTYGLTAGRRGAVAAPAGDLATADGGGETPGTAGVRAARSSGANLVLALDDDDRS